MVLQSGRRQGGLPCGRSPAQPKTADRLEELDGVGARNHRPPRTSSRAKLPSAALAIRLKARASKPSHRDCPNKRREVHCSSVAETTATLAAAETATLKQAQRER